MLGDLGHSRQLGAVAGCEIEERELVKLLELLVAHLDDGMISVSKRLGAQPRPELGPVQLLRHLDGDLQVPALDRKLKPRCRILHELECNLGIAFLLQVGNDGLADQTRVLDDVEHFLIVPLDQRQLEAVFGGVDLQDPGLR